MIGVVIFFRGAGKDIGVRGSLLDEMLPLRRLDALGSARQAVNVSPLVAVPRLTVWTPAWCVCSLAGNIGQGALIGLYVDNRFKTEDEAQKPLPLETMEIIGGEVRPSRLVIACWTGE